MNNSSLNIQRKYILWAVLGFIVVCVLYYLIVVYPRVNKVAVDIQVYPEDAKVYVNGVKKSSGTVYLKPGNYTFIAKKSEWKDDKITQTVSKKNNKVALVPDPNSAKTETLVMEDAVVSKREALAGVAANARGDDLRNDNPIIDILPYSDIAGPFKVDFGYNREDYSKLYLIVSFSTPNGREKAISWLKKNKVNVTTREIIFEDFNNPAFNGGGHD